MEPCEEGVGCAQNTAPRHPCRVLVADDDPPSLVLASEAMRLFGCSVIAVGSGTEAIKAIEGQSFDLLVLDIQMPGMTGLQVVARVRQFEALGRRRTPAVALTAGAMADERQACLDAGMDGVLLKPLRLDQLKSMLDEYCSGV